MSEKSKKPTYRILRTVEPRHGDQGSPYFQYVCIASKHHATIVRNGSDDKVVNVDEVSLCDCKDLKVFPELEAAIKAFDLDKL